MNNKDQNHIVIVEAYEGFIEYLSDEPGERKSLQGLGLPVEEIAERLDFGNQSIVFKSARVRRIPIPTRDPDYWLPFDEKGLSPRSYGLINDSGLLFFVSYCLNKELQIFYNKDPFQAIILPMWGGLGYVSQMARATRTDNIVDVPFAVVVTDTSANRLTSNQEGVWTRYAIIRRQMEDISLALADLVLVFGSRGNE